MPAYYLEALTVALGLILLLWEAFSDRTPKATLGLIAAAGLAGILIATFLAVGPEAAKGKDWGNWPLWNFYNFDSLSRFYKAFALITTILVLLLSVDYRSILARFTDESGSEKAIGEFYSLPVFACAGLMWMASAKDLTGIFVALELVTITFYILVTFLRRKVGSLEAGVKYLILGALSTGFLVYGIAWVYGATGTMSLEKIGQAIAGGHVSLPTLLFGVALLLVALGFKVGAVPMQAWIPDVYQGAPTPITAFLSVGSKAAGFIVLIRVLEPLMNHESVRTPVLLILAIMATATLIFGNLIAIPQSNFKRLLAYSSIAHAGFLLLALAAWQNTTAVMLGSKEAVSFYLATYLLMTIGTFFVLAQIRIQDDSEEIDAFNGLGKRNPKLAMGVTVLMAALAGVPLTAGFVGKFFVFALAVNAGLWWGVAFAFLGAAAGFYYYFKIIRAMWWNEPAKTTAIVLPCITRYCVAVLVIAVLVFGFYPKPIQWLLGLS